MSLGPSDNNDQLLSAHYAREDIAGGYSKRYNGALGRYFEKLETKPVLKLAGRCDGVTLDYGCGTGRLLNRLAMTASRVIGVDRSEAMLKIASRSVNASIKDRIETIISDGSSIPLPDSSVDTVIAIGTFEHVSDLTPTLLEMFRVMRPGGVAAFTCHSARTLFRRKPNPSAAYAIAEHTPQTVRAQAAAAGFVTGGIEFAHFIPHSWYQAGLRFARGPLSWIWTEFVIMANQVALVAQRTISEQAKTQTSSTMIVSLSKPTA